MDSATLAKQLADYDANRKSSADVLNDAMKQYGIPEMRTRVSGLRTTLSNTENAINAVDPSVTGRTQGSLVTEAQRQAQVANERKPLTEQYGQLERGYSDANSELSDSMLAAKTLADANLSDYSAGRTALQSRYEAASAKEQADKQYALQQQQLELQKKAAASAVGGGYNISGGGGQAAPAAVSQQRKGGGFDFQDASGKPISAAKYAQLTGQPLGTVLYNMGKAGDTYAQALYNQFKAGGGLTGDPAYDARIKKTYAPIFWGT